MQVCVGGVSSCIIRPAYGRIYVQHKMNSLLFFAVGSAFLVFVSRKTLLRLRSHGFYRFFAWECILALVVINFPDWTTNPFTPQQIISWLFLLTSIFLVIHGVRLLRLIGKPNQNLPDNELLCFEKTTRLVTVGAYKYIRHPLYSSLLFLAWGAFLKQPASLPGLLLALIASFFLVLTAKSDESECLLHFGEEYRIYMLETKRFVPFLF